MEGINQLLSLGQAPPHKVSDMEKLTLFTNKAYARVRTYPENMGDLPRLHFVNCEHTIWTQQNMWTFCIENRRYILTEKLSLKNVFTTKNWASPGLAPVVFPGVASMSYTSAIGVATLETPDVSDFAEALPRYRSTRAKLP